MSKLEKLAAMAKQIAPDPGGGAIDPLAKEAIERLHTTA